MDCGLGSFRSYDRRCFIFHKYKPCSDNLIVRIADGSLSKVAGTSSVVILKNLTLDSVFLVPNLDCNLLSINKLTHEKNCVTKFFLISLWILGFEFGEDNWQCWGMFRTLCSQGLQLSSRTTSKDSLWKKILFQFLFQIMILWHYRLGHPSFKYLKHLFRSLFNKYSKEFQCEVCQLSKHVRSSYPLQPYKLSHPSSSNLPANLDAFSIKKCKIRLGN